MPLTLVWDKHNWIVSGLNKLGTYKYYNCSSVPLHYTSEELLWDELVHHAAADQNPSPLKLYSHVPSCVSMSFQDITVPNRKFFIYIVGLISFASTVMVLFTLDLTG